MNQQPHILQFVQSPRLFRLSPSSRSRHRFCCRTATFTHFWSSTIHTTFHYIHYIYRKATQKTALELLDYSVNNNTRVYQIHKEGGVVNRFLTARRHFWTPWSERTHCMENGQSVFFLSPHTPYGRVRLARFARVRLLRHALPISLLILRKKTRLFCSLPAPYLWQI